MEMDISVNVDKVDFLCRVCHCEGINMRLLTSKIGSNNRTIAEVLSFVLNIYISVSEEYSKQVCDDCYNVILRFYQFKKRCIASESSLNDNYYAQVKGADSRNQISKSSIRDILFVDKFYLNVPYQCSICSKKFSDMHLLKSHVLTGHRCTNEPRRKVLTWSENLINLPEYTGDASFYNSAVDDEVDELESNRNAHDFTESTSNFTVFVECKQEIEDVPEDKFKCICGVMLDTYDEYRLHLGENNCCAPVQEEKPPVKPQVVPPIVSPVVSPVVSLDVSPVVPPVVSPVVSPAVPPKVIIKNPKKKIYKTCPKCHTEFGNERTYKMHINRHKFDNLDPSEIFNCEMCMRRFLSKSSYDAHLKTHETKANIKFICNTCKREFQHQAHLDNHILAVHTKVSGYNCEYCGKHFVTEDSLNNHKDGHKIEKRHHCHICKKAFYMQSTLRDHLRTHTGEKPFLCSSCGKGFSQKNNLVQHMRRHQGLKLFKCEQCDQGFVSKGELVAHKRKHSGAHPFVCDECGKGFTTSSSLVKHRRIHTGEKPFSCDLCNMKFNASGTLKNHMRIHTGEKPFQCSHCEKAFTQRHDLVSHIRCHTGERPFVCPRCEQAFRKASGLKAHLKVHAKEAMPPSVQKDATLPVFQDVITG